MSSKFFGNSLNKNTSGKKGGKQKMSNKNNKPKASGVRKVGRGKSVQDLPKSQELFSNMFCCVNQL